MINDYLEDILLINYAIQSLEKIDDIYTWKFDTLHEARIAAKKLSEKYKVEVIVLKIIGTFKPVIFWSDGSIHSTYVDNYMDNMI